jgi:thymidylate synthase
MLAQVCDLGVHEFIHVVGDAHIYKNHVDAMKLQLSRELYPLPTLRIHTDNRDINKFTMDDFDLENYSYHASIPAPMAV